VSLAAIQGTCECGAEFAYEPVVGQAEVAEFEGEADEVDEEVWGVDAAVDEDGAVDVGVGECGEG
jgi:hypothetical protein